MKFSVSMGELKPLLSRISLFAGRGDRFEYRRGGLFIKADRRGVRFECRNEHASASGQCTATTIEEGMVLVNTDTFLAQVGGLGEEGMIVIECEEPVPLCLTLRAGDKQAELPVLAVGWGLIATDGLGAPACRVVTDARRLADGLSSALRYASKVKSGSTLRTICLHREGKEVLAVGANKKRAGTTTIAPAGASGRWAGLRARVPLLPSKAARGLLPLLAMAKDGDEVELSWYPAQSKLLFQLAFVSVVAGVIDGIFPDDRRFPLGRDKVMCPAVSATSA